MHVFEMYMYVCAEVPLPPSQSRSLPLRFILPFTPFSSLHACIVRAFLIERFATDRADMGGVGCFNRQNRTLYVAGFHMAAEIHRSVEEGEEESKGVEIR